MIGHLRRLSVHALVSSNGNATSNPKTEANTDIVTFLASFFGMKSTSISTWPPRATRHGSPGHVDERISFTSLEPG